MVPLGGVTYTFFTNAAAQQGSLLNLPASILAKLLFIAKTKDITAGRLYNEVGEDYLTSAGTAGSETYQVPNTAAYIAADEDYIWFKTDETQRTTTTDELISYDFSKTLVKYSDSSPYAISEIAIIKAEETLTTSEIDIIHRYFKLSVWWSVVLNLNGHIKENRTIGRAVWTPEIVWTPAVLSNCNLYLRADKGVTVIGSGVSEWIDYSGKNNNATQGTDSARPPLVTNALNGLPVIDPDAGDFLSLTSAIASLNNYTIAFIAYAKAATDCIILSVPDSGNDYIYLSGRTMVRLRIGSTNKDFTISISEGYHYFTFYRNYVSPYTNILRIDGVQIGTIDNAGAIGSYTGLLKTSGVNGTNAIGDVVIYSDCKSSDDIALVEGYLKSKYGL